MNQYNLSLTNYEDVQDIVNIGLMEKDKFMINLEIILLVLLMMGINRKLIGMFGGFRYIIKGRLHILLKDSR
jgi:maltodextrin utilization protein YvdJ